MLSDEAGSTPGRQIRQQRGRRTYEALISTGFKMLERHEFDEITVADLAREAGYSVGAFYARFRSKDEFLSALVVQHLEYRNHIRDAMFEEADSTTLADALIRELVSYYWKHRRFWRAALMRGMRDPEFWKPFQKQGRLSIVALQSKLGELAGRELTEDEKGNVRYAFQIALGMINNAIVNRPGPTFDQGKRKFVENLIRAFRLVSDYDRLTLR